MNNAQKHHHREQLQKKAEERVTLKALIAEWEPFETETAANMRYVSGLRRKLHQKEQELINMGGDL